MCTSVSVSVVCLCAYEWIVGGGLERRRRQGFMRAEGEGEGEEWSGIHRSCSKGPSWDSAASSSLSYFTFEHSPHPYLN